MSHSSLNIETYKSLVALKFQLYNSLFTSLPFHKIEKTGILLSVLLNVCEEGFTKGLSPEDIIDQFFRDHSEYDVSEKKSDLLFRFIQYIERQVVLFDALEDAAFAQVHDLNGAGTLAHLKLETTDNPNQLALSEKWNDFAIRLVLTAHPTQFYPDTVLGIINDLSKSLASNNVQQVNMYLQQLGKTAFFKKQQPTPFDEATSLIWYLENVFYPAIGNVVSGLKSKFPQQANSSHSIIKLGFWPGGDRDGNPNVKVETTLKVAAALRGGIIKCYYLEVRRLKRRLTFKGVYPILSALEKELYNELFSQNEAGKISPEKILADLYEARKIIIKDHDSLFLPLIDVFINKVMTFRIHFASIDIRQNSAVHTLLLQNLTESHLALTPDYVRLNEKDKIDHLTGIGQSLSAGLSKSSGDDDTISSMQCIKKIQQQNGLAGCHRYIISHCESALNIIEVYGLLLLSGWDKTELTVDIVPLFETIEDLHNAATIMETVFSNSIYRNHLANRGNEQTIMLGFSDGSKDGGYLMGNWSIYKAKEQLTRVAKAFSIDILFFDGRGGPPARGGGKTNKFYASMGNNIYQKEIQLTIQGQTVSSNFGTVASAQYNIEGLIHAGISNELFSKNITLESHDELLLQTLANLSFESYCSLKNHPLFFSYLSEVTPLNFYADANISSRPANRTGKLNLNDLRAIPFVGAWSQVKQNVPGYFGLGTALEKFSQQEKFENLKQLYSKSLFFKTMIDNCEMSMMKCFFPLTSHLKTDEKFSEIWNIIYSEFELTRKYILLLSGKHELMSDYPMDQLSIIMRERIVLPLTTIQQYAITKLRKSKGTVNVGQKDLEKLVIRSSFGIINAGRNSV